MRSRWLRSRVAGRRGARQNGDGDGPCGRHGGDAAARNPPPPASVAPTHHFRRRQGSRCACRLLRYAAQFIVEFRHPSPPLAARNTEWSSGIPQVGRQRRAAARQPGFDRSDRRPRFGRDLRYGEIAEVVQDDRSALFGRQLPQRLDEGYAVRPRAIGS
jgi:hypothetical protein